MRNVSGKEGNVKTLSRNARIELTVTRWLAQHTMRIASLALGTIYLWFGLLKFVPGTIPIKVLAGNTIDKLTFGHIPPSMGLPILGVWECLIGLGFLTGYARRATLFLFFLQIPGTLLPLLFFPRETFIHFPYEPSMDGQYILKNMVLVSTALLLIVAARGGTIHPGTEAVRRDEALRAARSSSEEPE